MMRMRAAERGRSPSRGCDVGPKRVVGIPKTESVARVGGLVAPRQTRRPTPETSMVHGLMTAWGAPGRSLLTRASRRRREASLRSPCEQPSFERASCRVSIERVAYVPEHAWSLTGCPRRPVRSRACTTIDDDVRRVRGRGVLPTKATEKPTKNRNQDNTQRAWTGDTFSFTRHSTTRAHSHGLQRS
jgi:hypothetical protein